MNRDSFIIRMGIQRFLGTGWSIPACMLLLAITPVRSDAGPQVGIDAPNQRGIHEISFHDPALIRHDRLACSVDERFVAFLVPSAQDAQRGTPPDQGDDAKKVPVPQPTIPDTDNLKAVEDSDLILPEPLAEEPSTETLQDTEATTLPRTTRESPWFGTLSDFIPAIAVVVLIVLIGWWLKTTDVSRRMGTWSIAVPIVALVTAIVLVFWWLNRHW